ncbi:alpha-galactosidase [Limosilactobacillus sp. STM2_1]|uniref:alpha-galactosidase n=1 Tax=Limosilactobacillus rudii TaxID=2759755 RepID=A0A7W3ULW5_9LACO|nr:glycoside hydrolase family 36 protein [Limosilactobacillus rudii]MBB1079914.1 alpha-galactosidase [Limosilactobacillus rudii]MBB1097993.1 alpha-galactosidase [Limosilactobacillus rudii]MCD7135062.1 alpha-galactosidase [Limosilactobacillus rudii]
MKKIEVKTPAASLGFEVLANNKIILSQVNSNDLSTADPQLKDEMRLVELQLTGENIHHKGVGYVETEPGSSLYYVKHQIIEEDNGKTIKIVQEDRNKQIKVISYYRLYTTTAVIRSWVTVENIGNSSLGIEYVSSFALTGINQANDLDGNYATDNAVYLANNTWTAEAQWEKLSLKEVGLNYWVDGEKEQASSKRISISNTSSWSCSEYSPNGMLVNNRTGQTAIWQIENNGSWHYELTDIGKGNLLALRLSGPEETDNQWWKNLNPGEQFTTVPVAFAQVQGDFEQAIGEMTKYRRVIRRPNKDNQSLAVIFNDYMNCLSGDPTTVREKPLIDAAKKVGCEYYVIDCGWYDAGYWWDNVGEWLPSKERFPNGIEEVIDYIRSKGMVPGLWLEIEAMGIKCPLADKLPDDWFFTRHGKRVIDTDRYHLNFANPAVRDHADKIIDRLVKQYGIGYIKMDYNITTGVGTDYQADSYGDGLLNHNRAYLKWLDNVFKRYPNLIIENCGSGGMRHDYAMLQRHSIQSMTDQTEYVRNGNIAAAAASEVTPEQCAIWSYPLQAGDDEEAIFNMVNAMLLRIHQSGRLDKVDDHRQQLVMDGINVYKQYREKIPFMLPVWPQGLGKLDDSWFSYGLKGEHDLYLAIWRGKGGNSQETIDLSKYGQVASIKQLYPIKQKDEKTVVKVNGNRLVAEFPQEKTARLYQISLN